MKHGSTSFIAIANDFVPTIFLLFLLLLVLLVLLVLLLPDNPTSFKNEDSCGASSCLDHFRPFPTMSRPFPTQTRAIHTQTDHMTWIQEHATHDRWLQAHKNCWWLTPCTAGLNGFQVTRPVLIVLGNFWAVGVWSNFAVLATSSKFFLSEQLLSKI